MDDKNGWLKALKEKAVQPYPEELRRNIFATSHAVPRKVIPSYPRQVEAVLCQTASAVQSLFDVVEAQIGGLDRLWLDEDFSPLTSLPVVRRQIPTLLLDTRFRHDFIVVRELRACGDRLIRQEREIFAEVI